MGLMTDYAWTARNGSFSRTKDSKHRVAKEALDKSLVWYEKAVVCANAGVVDQGVSQPSGAIIDKIQDENQDKN